MSRSHKTRGKKKGAESNSKLKETGQTWQQVVVSNLALDPGWENTGRKDITTASRGTPIQCVA